MKIFAGMLIVLMFLNGASATTYRSFVDQDYGFYKVSIVDSNKSMSYDEKNKTLILDQGDTIIWINYATPDWPITIISNEGLWKDRDAYLRWNYQKFNYTFNESGVYSIYIKECRRCQNQTIIVNPIETPVPKATITMIAPKKVPTPISTPIITPGATSRNIVSGFEIVLGIISLILISLIYKFRRT